MKKIIFLVLAVLGCNLHSHAQNCDSIARVEIIDKIKNYSPEDLLPYYDKDSRMWGYMTKEGKILTKPLHYSPYAFPFNPNAFFSGGCQITIYGKDYSFNTTSGPVDQPAPQTKLKTINKGFEVDTTMDDIVSVIAPKYDGIAYPVFKYQGKYYAIVELKSTGKIGIIDQEENIIPNFDFKYRILDLNEYYKDKKQLWFYFEDENENTGLKNLKGEVKFYNQLLSLPYYGYEQYSLQKDEKQSGIFDLKKLKWIIKPQSEVRYTDIVHVGLDPEKQTVYFVIEKGEDKYLIDLQGREYKPKK